MKQYVVYLSGFLGSGYSLSLEDVDISVFYFLLGYPYTTVSATPKTFSGVFCFKDETFPSKAVIVSSRETDGAVVLVLLYLMIYRYL